MSNKFCRYCLVLLLVCVPVFAVQANAAGELEEASVTSPVEFALNDADGKMYHLSDYRGKWVAVNFWATWCGPCVREIPTLDHFYQRHKDNGLVVLGINFEELTVLQLKQAIAELKISYPILRIGSVPLIPFEPLKGLPSTFIVSPQGELVKTWVGPVNEKDLSEYLGAYLTAAEDSKVMSRQNPVEEELL